MQSKIKTKSEPAVADGLRQRAKTVARKYEVKYYDPYSNLTNGKHPLRRNIGQAWSDAQDSALAEALGAARKGRLAHARKCKTDTSFCFPRRSPTRQRSRKGPQA